MGPHGVHKNRQRLLDGDVALGSWTTWSTRQRGLLSGEHFTVDGTLLEDRGELRVRRPVCSETFCGGCGEYFPIAEFEWTDGETVGT